MNAEERRALSLVLSCVFSLLIECPPTHPRSLTLLVSLLAQYTPLSPLVLPILMVRTSRCVDFVGGGLADADGFFPTGVKDLTR